MWLLHSDNNSGGSSMIKELFYSLLYAQSEKEVHQLVLHNPVLNNQKNWKPYGGSIGNYSSFENQQSSPEGALMEKVTNSIDAILVRQCLKHGIEPSSPSAPQSMDEAVKTLFNSDEIKNENVLVITDGPSKNELNIMVVDDGEGQSPDRFEDTLLSLQKGNKNSIKFVQGKFNMGSTGAVVFCGKYKYQLIASRRNPVIDENSNYIGFTLVRKHVRTEAEQEKYKNTWYEYFTIDGSIPRFEAESFNLIKDSDQYKFEKGTIVKMYNYDLTRKTQSFQVLKNEINRLLYYPSFPIYVHETRKQFTAVKKRNGITNIAYGNGKLLKGQTPNNRIQDALEFNSIDNELIDSVFGRAVIDIFVFKEKGKKELGKEIRGNNPIVFLMNGQVQYSLGTSYISSKLGFKLIKDSLIVTIDCTNLSKEFLDEGFFMANRETIRKNSQSEYFLNKITEFLREHDDLIRLNRERASQKVSSSSTKQLFENVLGKNTQDSILRSLFKEDDVGMNSTDRTTDGVDSDKKNKSKKLNEFPTYMRVKNGDQNENGENIFAVPINKNIKLKIDIDARDDYFSREDHPGTFGIRIKNIKRNSNGGGDAPGDGRDFGEIFSVEKRSLHSGNMNIHLSPKINEIFVGDEVEIQIDIEDIQNNFSHLVKIKFVEPVEEDKKKKRKSKEKLELPSLFQVYKDQDTIDSIDQPDDEKKDYKTWEDLDWDENVGKKKVVQLEPGIDDQPVGAIFINMNSDVLERILTEEGTTGTRIEFVRQQFLVQIYMNSFLIAAALSKLSKKQTETDTTDFELERLETEDLVASIIEEIAYITIKIQLSNLKNATNLDLVTA